MVKGVPPIGGRHELDTCDRYPQTRLLMRPGSKAEEQDRMGCADIEGASPASAMGINPRKTPHPSVDYGDVFHSSPHAWRRDAGNYTAFSGQLGQVCVPHSPSSLLVSPSPHLRLPTAARGALGGKAGRRDVACVDQTVQSLRALKQAREVHV
jgi:hypothetical protein